MEQIYNRNGKKWDIRSNGDEITLRTISNMFNVEIVVVSTLEQDGLVRFMPENSLTLSQITLRLFAKNQGFYHMVLRRDEIVSENESTVSLNEVEPELNEENESTMSWNKAEPELNEKK